MTDTDPKLTEHGYLYAAGERLSESSIFERNREFFSTKGIDAWNTNIVPHYVTNNPSNTYAFAQLLLGFLRDYDKPTNPDNPIYIVEMGAGTGRFAFHLLHQLVDMLDKVGFEPPHFCYVLTDLAPASVEFYKKHPKLQPLLKRGFLDYSVFDAENDDTLTLSLRGVELGPGRITHPLLLLGTYFFDAIVQDAFYADDGNLFELYLEQYTSKPLSENDPIPADVDLKYVFTYQPIEPADAYDDDTITTILHGYQQTLENAHFTFPLLGIRFLERMQTWSKEGLIVMTADKGYHHETHMHGRNPPRIDSHGEAVSTTVNFNAMVQYFTAHDALCLTNEHHHGHIDVVCMLMVPEPETYRELGLAFEQFVNRSGADDFFAFKRFYEKHYDKMDMKAILAMLRLAHFDGMLLIWAAPRIAELIPTATYMQLNDLFRIMEHCWEIYYEINEPHPLGVTLNELQAAIRIRYGLPPQPE